MSLWRDTLFKRLFLLMWSALVGSHLLAFGIVNHWAGRDMPAETNRTGPPGLPPLGTLPPSGPVPGMRSPGMQPPGPPPGPSGQAGDRPSPPAGGPDGGLPAHLLLLDYGVRILMLGGAAWVGAGWLTRPMRRLATAASGLAEGLRQRRPVPTLDTAIGTVEVRQAAQAFNGMAQQLRAQFDAQALLMAGISHDLRTPLTRLRMRLETLDTGGNDAPREACIADVQEMDALIGEVLQMVRAEQQGRAPQPVALHALLQALVDDLAEQGQAVHLRPVDAAAAQATVSADPAALRRVLGNLLGNALRHGGGAEVGLHADTDVWVVEVDDRGPGIAEHELEAVFQPFYRGQAAHATGGSGLGLYIARDLLRRDQGTIHLANRPGGGLRATLRWPRRA